MEKNVCPCRRGSSGLRTPRGWFGSAWSSWELRSSRFCRSTTTKHQCRGSSIDFFPRPNILPTFPPRIRSKNTLFFSRLRRDRFLASPFPFLFLLPLFPASPPPRRAPLSPLVLPRLPPPFLLLPSLPPPKIVQPVQPKKSMGSRSHRKCSSVFGIIQQEMRFSQNVTLLCG